MLKHILIGFILLGLLAMGIIGCNTQTEQPAPPVVAPAPAPAVAPAPAPAPAPAVPAPPRTELIPIDQPQEAVASGTPSGKGRTKGPGGVDAPISGPATEGDELLGNYTCQITSDEFPMGINPPPSGCRITKAGDGSLNIRPTGNIGLRGNVTDPKAKGFFINGSYNVGLGQFKVKARMIRQGANSFKGNGRGTMNDNKDKAIKYKLTMTKM